MLPRYKDLVCAKSFFVVSVFDMGEKFWENKTIFAYFCQGVP